jgi:hypothetical protein
MVISHVSFVIELPVDWLALSLQFAAPIAGMAVFVGRQVLAEFVKDCYGRLRARRRKAPPVRRRIGF